MSATLDQANILVNIASSLIPVEKLITGLAYMIGIIFLIKALLALKEHTESRGQSGANGMKESMYYIIAGSMCLFFPSGFSVLMNTTFGYSNILEYAPANPNTPLLSGLFGANTPMGQALTVLIETIGGAAYVRGWVILARAGSSGGQQPGMIGKAMTHIIGGVLAMNIIGTLEVFYNTLFIPYGRS